MARIVTSHRLLLVLLAVAAAVGAGCALTGVSRQDEIRLGQQTAAQVDQKYRTWEDPQVTSLGQRLAAVSDAPEYPYRFRVIDDKSVNAFALPGGPIYVTSGMISFVQGHPDQLAAVLGHEITHIARRHAAQQMQRQAWLGLGIQVLTSGSLQTAATLAANLEELGYSRNQEREADKYGAVYLERAGMDPESMVALLQHMTSIGGGGPSFLQNHPGGSERVRLVQQQINSGETRRLAGR